jgi:large subunit ribosomal protein L25
VEENALSVQLRSRAGKGVARQLRRAGRIPAVCYGADLGGVPISLDPRALSRLLTKSHAGMNTLIDLRVEEGASPIHGKVVLLKELQRDPVSGSFLHADLYAVDLDTAVVVQVPIHLLGSPEGVRLEGGMLDQNLRELELECLPRAIPDQIAVDVSGLRLNQSLHVRDLPLPEGVKLLSDPGLPVASVFIPKVVEEAAPAEAAPVEGAEPAAAGEGEAPAEAAPKAEE